ncbi:MAG TPA: hypothetical protein VFM82_05835 [Flavobacteriaceae bacterium]|nr:hypothetical protein [Flavobacteriaceae bacterium]
MTQAQVLLLIQQNIVQNNNEEITADVLRPILEEMLKQPNLLIGNLDDLSTDDKTSIVAAINELQQEINSDEGVVIHYGTGTPNNTPPASFDLTDYYVQQSGSVTLGMWQWNGNEWSKIENIPAAREILINNQNFRLAKGINNTAAGIEIGDIATGGCFHDPTYNQDFFGDLKCIDNTGDLTTGIGTKWEFLNGTQI